MTTIKHVKCDRCGKVSSGEDLLKSIGWNEVTIHPVNSTSLTNTRVIDLCSGCSNLFNHWLEVNK